MLELSRKTDCQCSTQSLIDTGVKKDAWQGAVAWLDMKRSTSARHFYPTNPTLL